MTEEHRNIFRQLGTWFTTGREDFFTASLAAMLDRNSAFLDSFLGWISPYLAPKEQLSTRSWTISAQVSRPSCKGDALLDMVLASGDLEMWFEHKTGSGLGQYDNLDQLEKYLDAASRVMLGIPDGVQGAQWPTEGPSPGRPRIALFYITRKPKQLDRSRYEGRLYQPDRPYGLTWPQNGHLRWRDLWPIAEEVLCRTAGEGVGDFETELASQFLDYWQAMPGMWKLDASGDWVELLPPYKELPEGQPCPFDELWDGVVTYARTTLGTTGIRPWRGYEQHFTLPESTSPEIDTIYVVAETEMGNLANWREPLGSRVLRLLLRRRGGESWGSVGFECTLDSHPVRGRVVRLGGEDRIEILAGVVRWPADPDLAARQTAVLEAFRAALEAAAQETGFRLGDGPSSGEIEGRQ